MKVKLITKAGVEPVPTGKIRLKKVTSKKTTKEAKPIGTETNKPDNIKENISQHLHKVPSWIGAGSGWGYAQDDALIMNTKSSMTGVQNEHVFIGQRSKIEVSEMLNMVYEKFELKMQRLVQTDGHNYDILQFNVYFFTQEDWSFLKNDYESHNGYEGDEKGFDKHIKLKNQRAKYYTTECWINIDSFYGK